LAVSDAIDMPIMIQDAPVSGTPLAASLLARELANIAHQDRGPHTAAKSAPDCRRGDASVGPCDDEEAITLMADLDADATGATTGGGCPDVIRQILTPFFADRRNDAIAAYNRWLSLINDDNRQCGLSAAPRLPSARSRRSTDPRRPARDHKDARPPLDGMIRSPSAVSAPARHTLDRAAVQWHNRLRCALGYPCSSSWRP
jgi:2-keto-3-deoxy-L-arabinonate dehydratase